MKKLLLFAVLCLVAAWTQAVPAWPEPYTVTQPDGSKLTLQLYGDEWQHITITTDGYTVMRGADGYYTYAKVEDGQLVASNVKARNEAERSASDTEFLARVGKMAHAEAVEAGGAAKAPAHKLSGLLDISKFRGLVVLVQYKDRSFLSTDAHKLFNDMITQKGYTGFVNEHTGKKEEYTGSVYDYFCDNSNGNFKPRFDVVGPVTVDFPQTYPSGSSNTTVSRCTSMFGDALKQLDGSINYKDYDTNGDGTVDMVFFIVAGGGSNYGVNNSNYLWPHASQFSSLRLDGVNFGRYACSTELYGLQSDSIVDGIGTVVHEFSHVLGLPDLYDVNYATNGMSSHPGNWSIMAGANYLNRSRTPAGYGSYERSTLGWLKPEVIASEGERVARSLQTTNTAFRINSQIKQEYFLLENRDDARWDAYLPGHGLAVWRVDSTSTEAWTGNKVNVDPRHNYYELVRACQKDTTISGYGQIAVDYDGDLFPGSQNVTELKNSASKPSIKSWSGLKTEWTLSGITASNGNVEFSVVRDPVLTLYESFNAMPLTSADTTGVQGDWAQWSLTKARVAMPDSAVGNGTKAIAILAKGDIHTTTAIEHQFNTIRFNFINPTSKTAIVRAYYSVDNGVTWLLASPFDGQQFFRVPSGESAEGEFRIGLSAKQKTLFKIYEFSGSTTDYCYIDDVVISYDDDGGGSGVAGVAADAGRLTVSRTGSLTIGVATPGSADAVMVYNASGAVVTRVQAQGGRASVQLPAHGFYVVTAGGKSAKVTL